MLTETSTRASGRMIKVMATAYMCTAKLERSTKVTGNKICNMDRAYKFTVMATATKACSNREREMEKELTTTQQGKYTKEAGSMAG